MALTERKFKLKEMHHDNVQNEEKIHVFISREAALIYSSRNRIKAQGIYDLLEEIASSFRINLVSEFDTVRLFLEAGADFEDIDTIIKIKNFLKNIERERDIHKINADKFYQKRIEKISSAIVSYYSKITEIRKSEIDDIPDFINLFGIKFNKNNYIVHIPSYYRKFHDLFKGGFFNTGENRNRKVIKRRFSDYWAESMWIAQSIMNDSGLIGIVVPDELSIINISNNLELLGVDNSIVSPVPYFAERNLPLLLAREFLMAVYEDFSYDSMMQLLTNPLLGIKEEKLEKIRKTCYDNNVTSGWSNWSLILNDLPDIKNHLNSLAKSMGKKDLMMNELRNISEEFMREYSGEMENLLSFLSLLDDNYFRDANLLSNYMEKASSWVKKRSYSESNVIIGKPEDMIGLEFDKVYISRLDESSSKRSFPEDARSLLIKIEGSDIYEEFLSSQYQSILNNSVEAVLTYSILDDDLNYTESVIFYDSSQGEEKQMNRMEIFHPIESGEVTPEIKADKYILKENLVDKLIETPVSPTSLEVYLDCHFKYFLQSVLYIQEIDEPSEFIDARTSGSLTHRILQENYSMKISPNEFLKRADLAIEEEIKRTNFQSKKRALDFYRKKYISNGRLGKFFLYDVRNAIERGRRFLTAELLFGKEKDIYYTIEGRKIFLKGIVDRVDESENGLSIIDYKSSLNEYPAGSLCNERKVQLFFYKLGVEHVYRKKVISAAYVSFKDTAEGYQTKGLYEGIMNESMEVGNCQKIIEPALSSLIRGNFEPFIRESGDIQKCERKFYCPFLNVCRGQERRW